MEIPASAFDNSTLTFIIIAALAVASIIIAIVTSIQRKRGNNEFLEKNPCAAKVYLSVQLIEKHDIVNLIAVNGEEPQLFSKGMKSGFYANPGIVKVDLEHTYTRPGPGIKTVPASTGLVRKELELAPGGSYILGFDRRKKDFIFEEYEGK